MILSFGEVLMDCFPTGNVIGGAPFNVIVHLSRLGLDCGLISKIGQDDLGEEVKEILERENLLECIQIDKEKATGYVSVALNNGQPSYTIHAGTAWEFIDYQDGVPSPEIVVFGSLSLCFPHNFESFKKYKTQFQNSVFVCDLNLRAPYYSEEVVQFCLETANILKINDEELSYLEGFLKTTDVLKVLKDDFGISKVILTEGSKGATVFWDEEKITAKALPLDKVEDTVGAGDSFTAMFIYGLTIGRNLKTNLESAMRFAGFICTQNGAVPKDLTIYKSFK